MSCGGIGALRGCVNAFLITAAVAGAIAAVVFSVRSHEGAGKGPLLWADGGRTAALARCRETPAASCEAVWRAARAAFLRRP